MGKLYSLISALLLTVSATFAAVPDSYEWWFDHDVSSAKSGTVSDGKVDLQIDTSDLPKGIHYFNLRLAEGDSIYGSVYRKLFHAFGPDTGAISYEYWYDHDFDSKVTGDISKGSNTLDLDVSSLSKGIHYFNCRLGYGDGSWGAVYRRMFHTIGPDSGAISYEYWYDSDYDSKVTGSIDAGTNHFELDISSLPPGVHYYNIRLGYGDGSWGSVYRKMVLNLAGNVNAVAYEYWIDNNYSEKTTGSLSPGANTYEVDLSGVRRGLHRFNYRLMTGEGVWGAPFTSYFYSESNAARFTHYEYWLDNDYANHVTGNATGNPTSFEVDLSGFDKSGGAHYFNLRTRDDNGDWSPIYRKLLVFNKTEKRQSIIGYRHYLDGTDLGYVEVERQFVDSYMFEINLPDSLYPSVKNRLPSFDGDRVYLAGADSIDYTMQVRTEFGWAAPQKWKLGIGNDFSTIAVAMEINSRHTFATPADFGFAAMKFTASGDSLYFRSDIPVALDIYKDGERVAALTPAQIKGMAMLRLEAGEYFGVLYGVEDAEAKEFTLHLMDTPNQVPIPLITYENEMVDISCTRKDAQIRYTLDGKDPEVESTLFTEPFPLKRNAVIKAKAWVEGSDIEPSAVAEFTIDSYKMAAPTGSFDSQTRQLTITCATEEAKIVYSINSEENWTDYSGPISITRNCTVYAKATRDGWNDSDVVPIQITELVDNVPAPVISFEDGMVEITCSNTSAEIHYTVDDENLTVESPRYEGRFALDRNATIRAFAFIPGLDIEPSDIVTKVIDSFKVATPYGDFNTETRMLTILCDTDDASIFYSYDRDEDWIPYTGPVVIEGNRTVYAMATRDGWNDSEIADIVISDVKCAGVTFGTYKGRYVSLSTEESDAVIRYTTDGGEPSGGLVYTEPFDVEGLCTVRAVAVKPGYMNSEVSELPITFYADEEHAETATEGLLASAFDWDESGLPDKIEYFRVIGRLNDTDYTFLRDMQSLRHLDLKEVADARIPENAFRDSRLISICLPEDLAECGDGILSETPNLSSVIWNSRTMNVGDGLTRDLSNPNLLLYVPAEVSVSGANDLNVVREGVEPSVTFRYGYPYYAARDFRAARVSLTHEFLQTTKVDTCRGWETIVLPFTPTSITHEVNGPIVPFAAWNEDAEGDKPFWLYRATSGGWEAANSIEACVPYIISMPNNPDYVKEFILGGKVMFSADGVDLGPDSSLADSYHWIEGMRFEGTFMPVEDSNLHSLNVNSTEGGLQPGSKFVPGGSTPPFGAYVSGGPSRRAIPLFGDSGLVDVPLIVDTGLLIETPAPGVLKICSGRECRVAVTTATGVTIRTLHLKPGETQTLEGLTRDLYIVAGRKVMVR